MNVIKESNSLGAGTAMEKALTGNRLSAFDCEFEYKDKNTKKELRQTLKNWFILQDMFTKYGCLGIISFAICSIIISSLP